MNQHDRALSGESVDGGWTKLYHHPRPTTSPRYDMPLSRNHSQQSWLPRRSLVSSPNASTPSAKMKGKERSTASADSDYGHTTDTFGFKSSDTSASSATAHDSSAASHSNSQHCSASLPSRNRTSILSVASDALGLRKKIGSVSRKKTSLHSAPHSSDTMPGVIEINAHDNTTVTSTVSGATAYKDCEHEERERLRDAAAQSIGLDPELLHDSSRSECRSFLDSPPASPSQPVSLPSFPATLSVLQPFIELSATLPKFTPPSSLLSYALAKQWKPRTILLTTHSASQKTHVHLFKGISRDDREIERLEVTEDSVIYVADEEVGGRGNVVKFAGRDVSPKRNDEGSLRTTWFLQIKDPAESQRWIAAIKNTVLTQRAMRAGLDIPTQMVGGNEPKGDMDVMFSMHLQRIISTRATKPSTPSPPMLASPSPSPSLRSLKINIPSSPSPTTTMKGIFSGSRPRSPSVDGSPALSYPPGHTEDSFGVAGTSLLTMLRTKSSADSSSSPSRSLPPLAQGRSSPGPSLRSINAPVVITASDLKISRERDALDQSADFPDPGSSSLLPGSNTPPVPSLSPQGVFTLSLQPPPRKGKHSLVITPASLPQQGLYQQASGNRSVAGNFGIPSRGSDDVTSAEMSPVSPDSTSVLAGEPGSFSSGSGSCAIPGTGDIQSEAVTPTQAGNGMMGTSSVTDKRFTSPAIAKRRSRQGIPLPKQPTPPSGPPPSIPPSENNHRMSVESSISVSVTCAVDRPSSSSSSNSHSQHRASPRSGSSLSPIFWRRTSSSSAYSANSASASDLLSRSQLSGPFKGSESSSSLRPVVGDGSGASLRPMSLSVLGPLPVAQFGKAKRRSMPPPRPAPNFAPPPAPTIEESASQPDPLTLPTPTPQKFSRSSFAQRALRHSLTSPKPPPSAALPPRPDEVTFTHGHRRSSSTGTPDVQSNVPPLRPPSVVSRSATPTQQPSSPPSRLSIRQRLRILSTPPTSLPPVSSPTSPMPSIHVSTLDLSDDNDNDNDNDLPTPYFQASQPFGLGEHIITIPHDPSFLQLTTPDTPTIPKPPPRSPFRPMPSSSSSSSTAELVIPPDHDFVSLSPPPRRSSKPITAATMMRPEERPLSAEGEESKLVELSHHGSVVSLGFVRT